MAGVKGKSGGPNRGQGRHATTHPAKTIRLNPEHRKRLAVLTMFRRQLGAGRISQHQVLEAMIDVAWYELDEAWQAKAEEFDQP